MPTSSSHDSDVRCADDRLNRGWNFSTKSPDECPERRLVQLCSNISNDCKDCRAAPRAPGACSLMRSRSTLRSAKNLGWDVRGTHLSDLPWRDVRLGVRLAEQERLGCIDCDRPGVDFTDLLILAQHYGRGPAEIFADGDSNEDGNVNFAACSSSLSTIAKAPQPSPNPRPPVPWRYCRSLCVGSVCNSYWTAARSGGRLLTGPPFEFTRPPHDG